MKRILVVEDDQAIRQMEARILGSAGYQVEAAATGDEALSRLKSGEPPHLVVLDVMMPGLSGLELSRSMKADERLSRVPVIFVTARSDAESMNAGFKAGGVLYLSKPFTRQKLLAMVGAVVGD